MRILLIIATVACLAYGASATEQSNNVDAILEGLTTALAQAGDSTAPSPIVLINKTKTALSSGGLDDETLKKILKLLKKQQENKERPSIALQDIYVLINDPVLLTELKKYVVK